MHVLTIQIDFICLIILTLVLTNLRGFSALELQVSSFKNIIRCFAIFSIFNIVWLLLPPDAYTLSHIVTCVKLIACTTMSLYWFLYIYYRVHGNSYTVRKWFALLFSPIFFLDIYVIVDLLIHLIDKENNLNIVIWILLNIISIGYTVASAIIALKDGLKRKNRQLRNENFRLATAMVFPLLAMLLQYRFPSLSITPPIFALTCLYLYISSVKSQVTIDQLTGLNNAYKLATYLENQTQQQNGDKRLFYVSITLYNMISLKGKAGEIKALEAIQNFAKFLQAQCKNLDVFLSRSGQNTFALIFEKSDFDEVEQFCKNLAGSESSDSIKSISNWPITFSIHWSEFGTPTTKNVDDLIEGCAKNCYKPANFAS